VQVASVSVAVPNFAPAHSVHVPEAGEVAGLATVKEYPKAQEATLLRSEL